VSGVRRALLLSLIERYLIMALALASNIAIARLLTPEQIGIYSVSMAVLGLAQVLRDFGIGSYLVQSPTLNAEETGTAFGMSMLLGIVLFLVTFLAAPFVASYYGDPRVASTLRICAFNFVALPLSTVPLALLRRKLQFSKTIHASIFGAVVTAVLSVGLAWLGFGVNSLALGAMLGNVAMVALLLFAAPPEAFVRPRLTAWRGMLKFGGQTSLTGLVTSMAMDMNDLVVGKVLGFQPVAVLSRAQGLMNMFNRDLMNAIRNVALPAFADAHRNGDDLRRPFSRTTALVTVFGWPFHALVALYALEVLHLLYGPQWHVAAPLVPVFSLTGILSTINALSPNLLTAVGRIDLVTRVELMLQPMRIVFIAIAALVFRSIEACAMAFLLSAIVAFPVWGWARHRALGGGDTGMREGLLKSGAVMLACALPALIQVSVAGWGRTQPLPPWAWLPTCAVGVVAGLVVSHWVDHPIEHEPHVQRAKQALRRWLRPASSHDASRG
jgi:O-antigen/teichoic acid export membrane protein